MTPHTNRSWTNFDVLHCVIELEIRLIVLQQRGNSYKLTPAQLSLVCRLQI